MFNGSYKYWYVKEPMCVKISQRSKRLHETYYLVETRNQDTKTLNWPRASFAVHISTEAAICYFVYYKRKKNKHISFLIRQNMYELS